MTTMTYAVRNTIRWDTVSTTSDSYQIWAISDIIIIIIIVNITNDDECHAVEPRADVRQDPQQQTKLHTANTHIYIHTHTVLAGGGAPKVTTDELQRVLNAAARVVSSTHKFDRGLSRLLHTKLHWLNVPERVAFKLGLLVFNCLHNQAPQYLVDLCQSVSSVASNQHLRSVSRGLLVVPRHRSAVMVGGLLLWPALRHGTGYQTV